MLTAYARRSAELERAHADLEAELVGAAPTRQLDICCRLRLLSAERLAVELATAELSAAIVAADMRAGQ